MAHNSLEGLEVAAALSKISGLLVLINYRLREHEVAYILNDSGAKAVVAGPECVQVVESARAETEHKPFVIAVGGEAPAGWLHYEELLAAASEQPAKGGGGISSTIGYTSGTTGNPKGVVYSHRSIVLHAFALGLTDCMAISQKDVVAPLQSMFHATAWGYPYAAVMAGSKIVLPGPYLDGESILDLLRDEKVTITGGVPTVWLRALELLEEHPTRWSFAPGLRTLCGGSAPPEAMIRELDRHGIRLMHLWGMTETSPAATVCVPKSSMHLHTEDEHYALRCKQGIPLPFVEIRAVNEQDQPVACDGETMGELQVRGPWVAGSYFNSPQDAGRWTDDGWFRTGDIATIDREGYLHIADRSKDLIKSGGEWISSVDVENALVGHSGIREAAVIAVPHPKWSERPIAVVVPVEGARVSEKELREFLMQRFSKWQVPDAFVFVDELPHTSTGKMLKLELRKRYRDWKWEQAATGD
jgi:fatty-acyl-CoA synthase